MSALDDLIVELAGFSSNSLGFVHFAFPWGYGELADREGPEPWQVAVLSDLDAGLISASEAIQIARTSGHGIGKSALVSWIILWAISTFEDTKGVVTANTETQLKTKTWAELAKWYRLFIGRELFSMTATALFSRDPDHEKTWRIDMVPWSERNPEAFAGLHNQGKRIIVIFDEASAIADVIWETTEGALTDKDTQIIWMAYGNPTKNTGRFRECFPGGRFAHRWHTDAIDSRTVSFTDKSQIDRWIADWGEDSDFVRIRVRGIFPRVDATSFISYEVAKAAAARELVPSFGYPVLLGVDVGRFGDDPSVIFPRCGFDARSRPFLILPGIDTMQLAARIAAVAAEYSAQYIFVDEGGVGGGVVDRLRMLRLPVIPVDFGAGPDSSNLDDGTRYANKRAEIWGGMQRWLKEGGCLPAPDPTGDFNIIEELTAPGFGLNASEALLLESKKDMRRRGVPSPNIADALATTFALPLAAAPVSPGGVPLTKQFTVADDYDPFERSRIYA